MCRTNRVKAICLPLFTCAVVLALATDNKIVEPVQAFSSGPPGGRTGAPSELTCAASGCHSGPENSGPGQFTIEAPARYEPGQTYEITVRHTTSDNSRRRWGFQLTVLTESNNDKAGELRAAAGLSVLNNDGPGGNRQYIEHGIESTFAGQTGGASWTFNWTAPAGDIGPVIFYAAGNQANNDGTNNGDQIYTARTTTLAPQAGPPKILNAAVAGKKLIISGMNFDQGARVFLDGARQKKTVNDDTNPSTMLIAKKSGKKIPPGAAVTLQVENLDGTRSEPFSFTRPAA